MVKCITRDIPELDRSRFVRASIVLLLMPEREPEPLQEKVVKPIKPKLELTPKTPPGIKPKRNRRKFGNIRINVPKSRGFDYDKPLTSSSDSQLHVNSRRRFRPMRGHLSKVKSSSHKRVYSNEAKNSYSESPVSNSDSESPTICNSYSQPLVPDETKENTDDIKMLYCIDRKYLEITDPGGIIKEGETFLTAAVRELYEETLGIFDFYDSLGYIINNSISYYNKTHVTIYQPVDVESIKDTYECFKRRYNRALEINAHPSLMENVDLLWLSVSEMKSIVSGNTNISKENEEHLRRHFDEKLEKYPPVYDLVQDFTKTVFTYNSLL